MTKPVEPSAPLTLESKACPHCGANLVGAEIPRAQREAYGGANNFTRVIVVKERYMADRAKCPDCGKENWLR